MSVNADSTEPLWMPRVAVVGAGISGLICARRLQEQGFQVTVFEKSRSSSGRAATRRVDLSLSFDHGAQYFTVRDPSRSLSRRGSSGESSPYGPAGLSISTDEPHVLKPISLFAMSASPA